MQNRYIPAVTMLSAGAIVSIFCIMNKVDVLYSLKLLLAMLILFYIIGLAAKRIIGKVQEEAQMQYAERVREEERQEREARERALQGDMGTEEESEEESQREEK